MPGSGQQRRRQQRRLEGGQAGNRRIYDPRRWHKKSTTHGNKNPGNWGQPPAGWMLVWAGRFKRWRRRWFVAHPPGLLLHYKNGDQIGRPGCISLLGATASPTPGKERQMKIIRGAMVYYLRTINKDYRQPWLDAIQESMRIYNKSVQKAAVGVMPGRSLLPQESVSEHVKEEWEAQERELNRRLAERMEDLEPSSQAFLQQLQALQQSLAVISGALGFTEKAETQLASTSTGEAERQEINDKTLTSTEKVDGSSIRRSPAISGDEAHQRISPTEIGGNEFSQNGKHYITSSISLPDFSLHRTQRSIFKWKSDGESKQGKKRSSKSAPSASLSAEKSRSRSKRRSFSFNLDDSLRNSDYYFLREGSCIGGECFKWKRKTSSSEILDLEELINTEVASRTHSNGVRSPLVGENENFEEVECHAFPPRELGETADGSIEGEIAAQHKDTTNWESTVVAKCSEVQVGTNEVRESEKQGSSIASTLSLFSEKSGPVIKGPLHAAWHRMHEAFAEALKVEIHRALELEAENAVLQESLASLPQLKKDHKDLLSLRESLQNSGAFDNGKSETSANRDGEDEDARDSDDEIAIVHSERGDEEYFEALEVLNQHDFISKSTPAEDSDGYSDRDDSAHEPPEEGDVPVDGEVLSEAEGDDLEQPRNRLPAPRPLSRGFSLWTVLKNAIGKDLNHITMPATINEPLSVLQKCAEEMQYRYLLERAGDEGSSIRRLLHVSAFACATYHGSIYRDAKPFNPLLGETYEWLAPDEKSWFLTEQVSHHPPIMAFHSESIVGDYKIYGEVEIRNKFWGKSVEVLPTGVCHLRYGKYGDHITWSKVTTCAHNVVVGKLWIDNYGELVIKNHTTGEVSRIRFHKAGSKDRCRITGKIYDGKGVPQYTIYGNYQENIFATREPANHESSDGGEEELLWKSPVEIEDFHQQYCFSKFSIGLNELTTKLAEVLPPTDSRFRPDQRALEDGDLEKATPEKLRLEEKQRLARKLRKERGEEWKCLWFDQRTPGVLQVNTGDDVDEPRWVYQGNYWEMREKQNWLQCPDIM